MIFFAKMFCLIEILVSFTIMKLFLHKNCSILSLLLIGVFAHAKPQLPAPTPPPPPGLSIEGDVFVLLGISILFGLYKLYQYKLHKKMPA